jgi:fumarate hydratase subunit beta
MEKAGIRAMIGKGNRNSEVIDAMKKYSCVYFAATGGLGALLAKCITSCEIAAFEDLGPEALRKLTVEKFPVIVAIDAFGNNMYSN